MGKILWMLPMVLLPTLSRLAIAWVVELLGLPPRIAMTVDAQLGKKNKTGILLVDDNASVRSLLQLLLQGKGFTVLSASKGEEAVDLVKRQIEDIDLAIIDVNMPDMDGPRTLESIRAINPSLICCFITGGSQQYNDQDLLGLGVNYIFKKPIASMPQFLAKIREVIQSRENTQLS